MSIARRVYFSRLHDLYIQRAIYTKQVRQTVTQHRVWGILEEVTFALTWPST